MADENDSEKRSVLTPQEQDAKSKKITSKPVCRFYAKSGFCKYKENCRFSHSKSADVDTTSSQVEDNKVTELPKQEQNSDKNSTTKKKRCRYFNTKKGCSKGDACPFAHTLKKEKNQKLEEQKVSNVEENKPAEATNKSKTAVLPTENIAADTKTDTANKEKTSFSKSKANISTLQNKNEPEKKPESKKVISTTAMLSALDDDQLEKLRTREIDQLLRRFGKKKATEISCTNGTMYSVVFTPSDPDWVSIIRV